MYQMVKWHIFSACALGVLLSGSMAHAIISDGLEGYYKLDENNGTALGTTVINYGSVAENGVIFSGTGNDMNAVHEAGVVGTSYHLVGIGSDDLNTNNCVLLGTTIADHLNLTDTATVSAWVNPDVFRAGTAASSRSYILGTDTDISLSVSAGNAGSTAKITWNYKAGLNTDQTVSSATVLVPKNAWSMLTVTRANDTSKMYFNGMLVGTFVKDTGNFQLSAFDHDLDANAVTPDAVGMYIGTIYPTGTTSPIRDFEGYIDEVGIWVGQARTEQEIAVMHGLSKFVGVGLNVHSMDNVLAVFNAATGSAGSGGYAWNYVTGLSSTTLGETGGSVGGGDAWIALDASGNGVQIGAHLHAGDANGDGKVNLSDLQILGDNWQSAGAIWDLADFSGDGSVNLADLQILGDNWGFGVGPDISFDAALSLVGLSIPEPTSLVLLAAGASLILSRRRK